jgi:hypothetical protein
MPSRDTDLEPDSCGQAEALHQKYKLSLATSRLKFTSNILITTTMIIIGNEQRAQVASQLAPIALLSC